MEQRLLKAFDTYFNNILKRALGYDDTFEISIKLNLRQITLLKYGTSQLISRLVSDNRLLIKIEEELLHAFRTNNPNISYVKILLPATGLMIINYGFSLKGLHDIGIYANIYSKLPTKELNNLCLIGRDFDAICNNNVFWIELFKNRFGEIPDWIPKNINYKKFYMDILNYLEFNKNFRANLYLMEFNKAYRDKIKDKIVTLLNNLDKYSLLYIIHKKILKKDYINYILDSKYVLDFEIVNYLKKYLSQYQTQQLFQTIIGAAFDRTKFTQDIPKILELYLSLVDTLKYYSDQYIRQYIKGSITEHISKILGSDLYFNREVLEILEKYIQKTEPSFDMKGYINTTLGLN